MTEGQDTSQVGTLEIGGQTVGEQTPAGQDAAKPPATADTGDGQNFLLDYAKREDAERGVKAGQAKITELANEVKTLKESAQMEKRVQMMEESHLQAQQDRVNASSMEAQRMASQGLEDIRKQIEEDPSRTADILNDQVYRQNQALAAQKEELTKQFEGQFAAMQSGMDDRFFENSSEYQTYSEEIGQLKLNNELAGLSSPQLLAMAKTMNPDKVVNMAGSAPMSGSGGNVYASPPPVVTGYDDRMKQQMRDMFNYTEEQIVESEARFIAKQGG